jgi:hypothetical protein
MVESAGSRVFPAFNHAAFASSSCLGTRVAIAGRNAAGHRQLRLGPGGPAVLQTSHPNAKCVRTSMCHRGERVIVRFLRSPVSRIIERCNALRALLDGRNRTFRQRLTQPAYRHR